eukprot:349823-Pleurochrysis_carterae.AAC.1
MRKRSYVGVFRVSSSCSWAPLSVGIDFTLARFFNVQIGGKNGGCRPTKSQLEAVRTRRATLRLVTSGLVMLKDREGRKPYTREDTSLRRAQGVWLKM